MTKRIQIRIVEIHLHKSKKNSKYSHAVAILFPCNHKEYLGLTRTPKHMKDNFMRVQDVKIWKPEEYAVFDKAYCRDCPNDLIWLNDIPHVKEAEKDELEDE